MDFQKMMKQAQEMQYKLQEVQEKLKDIEVEAEAGGGLVKVTMSCSGKVLKIDIEGAEKEVFLNSSSWIDKVDTIIVEPHDRFCPGCTEVLENVAKAQNFYTSISEESSSSITCQ